MPLPNNIGSWVSLGTALETNALSDLDCPRSVRKAFDHRQWLHNDGGGGADAANSVLHHALVLSSFSCAHIAHTKKTEKTVKFWRDNRIFKSVPEDSSLVQLNLGRHWSAISSLPYQVWRWDSTSDTALEQNSTSGGHNLVSTRVHFHCWRLTS